MKKLKSIIVMLIMTIMICILAVAAESDEQKYVNITIKDSEENLVEGITVRALCEDLDSKDNLEDLVHHSVSNGSDKIPFIIGKTYAIFPYPENPYEGYDFTPEYQVVTITEDTDEIVFIADYNENTICKRVYYIGVAIREDKNDKEHDKILPDYAVVIDGVDYKTDRNGILVLQLEPGEHTISFKTPIYGDEFNEILEIEREDHESGTIYTFSKRDSEPKTATPSEATPSEPEKTTPATSSGSSHSSHSSSSSGSSSSSDSTNQTNWTYFEESDRWTLNNFAYKSQWIYAYNPYATVEQGQYDWFHFDAEGYMDDGWFVDTDDNIYYLNPNKDNTRGKMMTGWQIIDENHYYFNEASDGLKGALYKNTTTPDGYIVDETGAWIKINRE